MNKRLVIKTSLICAGIFIIMASLAIFYVSLKYDLDTENRYSILVASKDIAVGDILTETNVGLKVIKESALTPNMLTDPSLCLGTKALSLIKGGDYLMSYSLLSPESWNESDDKIIVLPMNVEERLATVYKRALLLILEFCQKTRRHSQKPSSPTSPLKMYWMRTVWHWAKHWGIEKLLQS